MDVPIDIEQPTDCSGIFEKPGYVCKLLCFLHGAVAVAMIWSSLILDKFHSSGFVTSSLDSRMFFLTQETSIIVIAVIVDYFALAANDGELLEQFKPKLAALLDVTFY